MAAPLAGHATPASLKPLLLPLAAAATAAAVGMLCIPLVAFARLPAPLLIALPVAAAGAVALVWNTQAGLCFAAFAVAPLGIVQYETAGVTLNLPEVLILALFTKELVVFIVRREQPASQLPYKALSLFVFASLIGIVTGLLRRNNPVQVLQDFRQFTEFITLYLLIVHRVSDRRQAVRILACFVLGATLVAAHGVLQHFTAFGIPGVQALHDAIFYGAPRSGSFYGATPLGGLMVLAIGAAVALMLGLRRPGLRPFAATCAVVCLVAIVFTHTRASWLALSVAFFFIFLAVRKTPLILLAACAGVVVFGVTLGPIVLDRLMELEISKTERSLLERVRYYTVAWHIFRERPLFGLGWGCYYDLSRILVNERYLRPVWTPQNYSLTDVTVHSAYLQMLVKTGLLGLAGLLTLIVAWLRFVAREWRARTADPCNHALFAGIVGGIIGYLFHCAFENFFQWPVMAQSFWLLFGLSTVIGARVLEETPGNEEKTRGGASAASAPGENALERSL